MVVILSVVWGFSACAVWVTPRIWSFEVCAGEIRFHSVSEKIFPFRMILEKTSSFSCALQTISYVCIGNYGHFLRVVHGLLLGNSAIFRQKLVYFCVRVRLIIPFRKPSGGGACVTSVKNQLLERRIFFGVRSAYSVFLCLYGPFFLHEVSECFQNTLCPSGRARIIPITSA